MLIIVLRRPAWDLAVLALPVDGRAGLAGRLRRGDGGCVRSGLPDLAEPPGSGRAYCCLIAIRSGKGAGR